LLSIHLHADIIISNAWVNETVGNVSNTAAFLTITNSDDKRARLISVSTHMARKTEIHQMVHAKGIMRMRKIKQLVIPAAGAINLKEAGVHIMIMGLREKLKVGTQVIVDLTFASGAQIQHSFVVRSAGAEQ